MFTKKDRKKEEMTIMFLKIKIMYSYLEPFVSILKNIIKPLLILFKRQFLWNIEICKCSTPHIHQTNFFLFSKLR